MRLPIIVLAAFLGVALSGCVGGVGTITAKDGVSAAREAAEALDEVTGSAVLIGVTSLEPFSEVHDEDDDAHVYFHLDDNPGDGVAPGWLYEFAVGDAYVAIAYASGLGVLAEVVDGGGFEDEEPPAIEGWDVDSDDVADILAGEEEWPEPTDATAVAWVLHPGEECPVWSVESIDLETEEWVVAAVDACNGDVLEIGEPSHGFSCGFSYSGGSSSVLLPLVLGGPSPSVTNNFEDAFIHYEVDVGTGVGDVTWELHGPDGLIAEGTGDVDGTHEMAPVGEYTLEIGGDAAVLATVSYGLTAEGCD